MIVAKRVFVFVALMTSLLAWMDWSPLHYQWWHNGEWPAWAGQNFQQWAQLRATIARYVCPPCGALAEQYYFSLWEVEAGPEERAALLPVRYDNPVLPDGPRVWWKAGTEWYPVSLVAWYLYWLPQTVAWWWLYAGDLFAGRWPWWMERAARFYRTRRAALIRFSLLKKAGSE